MCLNSDSDVDETLCIGSPHKSVSTEEITLWNWPSSGIYLTMASQMFGVVYAAMVDVACSEDTIG